MFSDFCEKSYCDELVHCYTAIMDFKNPERTSDEELHAAMHRINDLYLRYGSNQEVNASVEAITEVVQALKHRETITRKSLDTLLADITPLLLQQLIVLKSSTQKDRFNALIKNDARI